MPEPVSGAALALGAAAVTKAAEKLGENLTTSAWNLLSNVVSQKWKHGTENAKEVLVELLEDGKYSKYYDICIKRHLSVRTLYNIYDDAFIDEFYHPLKIKSNRINTTYTIDDSFLIRDEAISNIIGVAGQGKTTLLRKIFLSLISNVQPSSKLPFILDLRNLKNDSIVESFQEILKTLEIDNDIDKVKSLFKSKKVVIILDGFDEVLPSKRETILKEILHLNDTYQIQLITSSRPGTEICTTSGINNYHVEMLTSSDVFAIIRNLVSEETSEHLINALKKNTQLLASIDTPILAVLLCVCEKHLDSMPRNAKEFYNRIFNILFEGHDKTKNFYQRFRKTSYDINDAKEIFCALCYISLKNNDLLNKDKLCEMLAKAYAVLDVTNKEKTEDLLDDFVDVTGLIRTDGSEAYTFVHRTIQEYHAAEFIKNSASSIKSKLLLALLDNLKSSGSMLNTCIFLHHIDTENTIEELIIPLMESSGFGTPEYNASYLAEHFYNEILGRATIIIKNKMYMKREAKNELYKIQQSFEMGPFSESLLHVKHFSEIEGISSFSMHDMLVENIFQNESCVDTISSLESVKKDGVINHKNSISLDKLLTRGGIKNRILIILANLIENMNTHIYEKNLKHLKARKENKENLLGL